ncbi:MAG TPA: MFS transporter [Beijerinckiaceae bacterium]|jgi:MFS family permease
MLLRAIANQVGSARRGAEAAAFRGLGLLSLYGIVLFAGFGGSYAIQILNLGLQQRGISGAVIGASTAVQALGIVAAACMAVPLLNRLGSARTLALGGLTAGLALAVAAFVENAWGVTAARFVCALGIGTLVTNAEYVVIARTPPERRATAVAVYATVFALGTALAPATIALLGCEGTPARLLGAAGFFLAALLVPSAEVRGRVDARPAPLASLKTIRLAPLAFAAALIFGALDNGLLSLIPLFAVEAGHSSADASALATAGFIGVILFQIPAGWCADRFSPQKMLVVCCAVAFLCVIGILTATASRELLFPLMVLLGGACDGFYTLGLAAMSRAVPQRQLAAGNACFVALCAAGEVAGPLLMGGGTSVAGPGGFVGAFALMLLVYGLFLVRRPGPRRSALPVEDLRYRAA